VIGIVAPQMAPQSEVSGVRTEDMNNLVYAPLNAVMYRLEDSQSELKDEVDGLYCILPLRRQAPPTPKWFAAS